jgi:hypothetical protein
VSARALSPAGALGWLSSLSIDLRASAVLDAGGARLAGDADVARRAAALLEATPAAPGEAARARAVEARDGDLLAVRSERHAVAAALGPRALERLARADLRAALAALDGR